MEYFWNSPGKKYKMDFLGTQDANGKKIKLHDQLFTNLREVYTPKATNYTHQKSEG